MKWENTTNYSKRDKGDEVRSTTLKLTDNIGIVVTDHIHYGDELVMHAYRFDMDTVPLRTSDRDEAQKKALERVREKIEKELIELAQAYNNLVKFS